MATQDDFQKKVLDTLKKNFKAVDLSDEQPEVQPEVQLEAKSVVEPVVEPRVLMTSSDFTAYGFPSAAGPTSGGNKDILILPGFGGAAATSASQINFYWNSPAIPDTTGFGTSIRTTIFNYATSATNPVLVVGGYNGTVNLLPAANYGGGSGTTARIWIDPFLARIDLDYVGFNSGVADTNVAGVLFYDSTLNVFKGGVGSGVGKTIAFTSDIPAVASSAALVNTDASTGTRFLIGTLLNTASSGGTSLSTGSGITIGNNVLTATTFQGSLTGIATTATTSVNLNTTALSGTIYLIGQTLDVSAVGASQFVAAGLSFASSTGTLSAANFSGTASSASRIITDASTATRYLVGTLLNTASTGGTLLSTGSGITIGNNIITATTFAGNATTSTTSGAAGKWITSRTVTFASGDVTGTFSIDGTADVSNVALTIGANAVALGTDTTGQYASTIAISGNGITATAAAGDDATAYTIYSSAVSTNTSSSIVFRDGSGNFSAGTITANLTGTASIASSAAAVNTVTDTASTLYLLGSRSSTGIASTQVYVDTNVSFVGNTITGNLTGTASIASSSAAVNTVTDTANTLYLLGSRSSTGIASTQVYVDTNVSVLGNTVTATTFSGALSGTAAIATSAAAVNTVTDTSSTLYVLGSRSSTGIASTQVYVDTNVSIVGNTITANLTGTASIASSAAAVNTVADTSSTLYLLGSRSSTGIASTQVYVDTNVSIVGSTITASLSGTATTATNQFTTTLSGTMFLHGQATSTGVATGTSAFVGTGLSFVSSTGTLQTAFYIGNGYQLSGIVTSLAAGTGILVSGSTGAVTVTNIGVQTLTGTANQVLVNGASGVATTGAITLTTPQSIGTASSPSFADLTLTTGSNSTLAAVGSAPTSMVNKQYVDNLASGLDVHGSVRLLQASAFTANYVQSQGVGNTATGSYLISTTQAAFPAIDGVTIAATGVTSRVLVISGFTGTASIAGTTPFTPGNSNIANGIYYVGALGGAGTSNWILVRATDTDDSIKLTGGAFTFVEEGTAYADSGWVCTNDTINLGAIQFGSTAITFSQFTGGGALGIGQGLNKVGNTLAAKINISAIGAYAGTGYTQFNLGGTSGGGTADTGYYPTFAIRTSGTVAGTALLTLNSDGFSLIGSTNSNRTVTVTGSDITLTGGGNTLTLTGSISLPAPTANGVAYGASGTAVAFLTAAGSGASVLTQTSGSLPVYLGQSQLVVGGASTAANIQGGSLGNINYQTGANATGFVTNAAGSGASILSQTGNATPLFLGQSQLVVGGATTAANIQGGALGNLAYQSGTNATAFVGNAAGSGASILTQTGNAAPVYFGQSQLVVGGASTAAQWQTSRTVTFSGGDVTGSFSINGSADVTGVALTVAANSVALGTDTTGQYASTIAISGSGITATAAAGDDGTAYTIYSSAVSANTVSTLVFRDGSGNFSAGTITANLTGTASIASSAAAVNTVTDTSSTLYLLGSRSSTGFASTQVYVDTNISIVGSTLTAGTFSGTASSAAQVNTDASTATRYLIGTVLNTASGSTQLSTGSGITIGNNRLTVNDLAVTNTTGSGSTTTGALTVVGGVGIGGTLNVGPRNLTYSASGLLAGFASSINGFVQIVLQNASTGATASADFIVNNDSSTDSTFYGSMGMNSSGFTGSGSLNAPNAVYFTSTTGDLVLGSTTANILRFVYNSGATDSMQITGTAVSVLYSTVSTSTSTGAFTVVGGVGIGGSLWTASANFSSISGVGHLNGVINSGVWSGTAISLANGGTNANLTATNGGVVYSTASAFAISAAGTAGSILVSAGAAAPTWGTVALGSANSVTGTLGISNGGTNATSQTTNGINFFNGTSVTSSSALTYVSGAGVTATENIRAAGFNIAGNSVVTSLTPSGGSAIYGGVTIAVANNGANNTLSVAGSGQTITITGPGTGITGTGTANSLAKFTATGQIGNANATDNGTTFAISLPTTVTSAGALTSGTYLSITTASGDDNSTSDYFIRGLTSGATSKFSVDANGNLRATTKSFDIEHPTKPGKRLVYGVLEGPEHGVYHRGTVEGKGKLTVELPEYWSKLVGADYSIQLTPWGNYNVHIVEKSETSFIIQLTGDPISRMLKTIKVDYIIHGSRLDAPLQIEQ